jgi:bifunctional non-homologous end joining protein LigD
LDPLIRRTSPLDVPVKKPKATWVEPKLQVEVQHASITPDKLLRHAAYKDLRNDLAAQPIHRSRKRRGKTP